MEAIRILENEHQNILQMLDIIKEIGIRAMNEAEFDTEDLRKIQKFIKFYADDHHHGKEEEILFFRMKEEIGETAVKAIEMGMEVEHTLGRHYSSELLRWVGIYEKDPSEENKLEVLTYLLAYREALTRHIEKEDEVIYPFGVRGLSEETLEEINQESLAFDKEFEENSAAQLKVLEELKDKYL